MQAMTYFSQALKKHLDDIGLKPYDVTKLTSLSDQYVYKLCRGEVPRPTDETLIKLSEAPELRLTMQDLKTWRLLDDYSENEVVKAFGTIVKDKKLVDILKDELSKEHPDVIFGVELVEKLEQLINLKNKYPADVLEAVLADPEKAIEIAKAVKAKKMKEQGEKE